MESESDEDVAVMREKASREAGEGDRISEKAQERERQSFDADASGFPVQVGRRTTGRRLSTISTVPLVNNPQQSANPTGPWFSHGRVEYHSEVDFVNSENIAVQCEKTARLTVQTPPVPTRKG